MDHQENNMHCALRTCNDFSWRVKSHKVVGTVIDGGPCSRFLRSNKVHFLVSLIIIRTLTTLAKLDFTLPPCVYTFFTKPYMLILVLWLQYIKHILPVWHSHKNILVFFFRANILHTSCIHAIDSAHSDLVNYPNWRGKRAHFY